MNQNNFEKWVYANSVNPQLAGSENSYYSNRNMMSTNENLSNMMMPTNDTMNVTMDWINMTPMTNSNMNSMINNLANPEEAFTRGNLFNNLYQQYKNYRPMRLVPNNEQADLLLKLNQYTFASHELRLYLDVHPDQMELINLFNQYREMANQAEKEYESKFGPLNWEALSTMNHFSWEETPWPWEMEVM